MDSIGLMVPIVAGLLLLSAFFSGSEAALFSLDRVQLRRLERDGRASSRRVLRFLTRPDDLLILILTGNTLVNVGLSVIGTSLCIRLFGERGVEVAILIVTVSVLLVGEVTPKTVAVNFPEQVARLIAWPLRATRWLLYPFILIVTAVSNLCLRLLRLDRALLRPPPFLSRGELNVLLAGAEGIMTAHESRLVQNILEFSSTRAAEVMTPRVDMLAAPESLDRSELQELVVEAKHSRIPIYRRTIDEIIGWLPTRDFLLHPEKRPSELLRPVAIYPDTALVSRIFYETQKNRQSLAIVVNEYGETVGLLTREDLLEELVGEIYDEYESREEALRALGPGVYSAAGQINLEELNQALKLDLPIEDAYTLNGFLTALFGGIPRRGETIAFEGVQFTISEVLRHRIQRCLIRLPEPLPLPPEPAIEAAAEPNRPAGDGWN